MSCQPNKYDYILKHFVSTDNYRAILLDVNNQDGYNIATDSWSVIRIKENLCGMLYKTNEKYPKVSDIFNEFKQETEKTIKTANLLQELTRLEYCFKYSDKNCEECDGTGESYCDYCNHSHDCEECNGSGTTTTPSPAPFEKMSLHGDRVIFEGSKYTPSYLNKILTVALTLGAEEFILQKATDKSRKAKFIFDNVTIILMQSL